MLGVDVEPGERDAPAHQDAADDLADAPEPGAHPHHGGSEGRECSAPSACRDDADLDQILGVREPGLDARPRRRLPRHDPLVPHRIYVVEVADVGQPDGGHQQLRLVAATVRQQLVYLVKDLAGLRRGVRDRVIGDDAGGIDSVAVDNGLAQSWTNLLTFDAHACIPPEGFNPTDPRLTRTRFWVG